MTRVKMLVSLTRLTYIGSEDIWSFLAWSQRMRTISSNPTPCDLLWWLARGCTPTAHVSPTSTQETIMRDVQRTWTAGETTAEVFRILELRPFQRAWLYVLFVVVLTARFSGIVCSQQVIIISCPTNIQARQTRFC